jgi:chromate transporter
LATLTVITESEIALLFIISGIFVWFWRAPPKWFHKGDLHVAAFTQLPIISGLFASADASLLTQIALFFAKAGAFLFGSVLAIVPFLYGGVVTEYQWLNDKQFIDAVAVAMITPGPVVITVGFIGYLVAGLPGACIAALAIFLPCYLLTIIPAPYFKKYGKVPGVLAFVDGITAATIGAIAGAVIVLAQRSLIDIPTILIALITAVLLWKFKKLPEPFIIVAAALTGLLVYPMMHP